MPVFEEPPRRTNQVRIVMTDEEKQRLHDTAKKAGLSVSDLIRKAVNEFTEQYERQKKAKK